jgi:outer membrane receptor protein involved in Fe transport
MFADIVQGSVREKYSSINHSDPHILEANPDSVLALVSYKPEYSLNYELGFSGDIIKNAVHVDLSVFYLDIRDVLITQFVESGMGRLLKNAGRAGSMGLEVGLTAYLIKNLILSVNYGYTYAVIKDNKIDKNDNCGNHIPFAPENTLSVSAGYNKRLNNTRIIDRFNVQGQFTGSGKIYWTEDNDVSQSFYGLLNMKAGVSKGFLNVNVWTRNSLNTDYTAFYFKTESSQLAQKGAPFQMGIDVTVLF